MCISLFQKTFLVFGNLRLLDFIFQFLIIDIKFGTFLMVYVFVSPFFENKQRIIGDFNKFRHDEFTFQIFVPDYARNNQWFGYPFKICYINYINYIHYINFNEYLCFEKL